MIAVPGEAGPVELAVPSPHEIVYVHGSSSTPRSVKLPWTSRAPPTENETGLVAAAVTTGAAFVMLNALVYEVTASSSSFTRYCRVTVRWSGTAGQVWVFVV